MALEVNMRPCGGFTPDMINFARSTNVYKIWADMIAFGGTDMPVGEHFYCAFAGRRDGKHFVYSHEQIMQKYQDNMRMVDRIPDALSGAMGNQMYVANFSTREGMEQFYSDVLAVTDDTNAAAQAELAQVLALGSPTPPRLLLPQSPPPPSPPARHASNSRINDKSSPPPGKLRRRALLSPAPKCGILDRKKKNEVSSMKIPANGFTHAGKFHADDVFCHGAAADPAAGHQDHPRLYRAR